MRRAGAALAFIGAIALSAGSAQANQARLADVCYGAVLDAATAYALGGVLRQAEDERTGHSGIARRLKAIQDELTQQMGAALDAGCPSDPFEQLIACFQSKSDGSGQNVPKASACVEQVTGRRDDPGIGAR
ncbi:hypothetical protein [Inquilinus limosus]|uniref:Uncharacterized protein n=1 Tax=Inquilinus limosus TaxID=171674 RepID=A0A211ZTD6_9PROT|nr:hypothetical protein [Inquilinus limosus]OWJ68530.1 hypothetical protein BWR60_03735 [Inquilinus limosus]